LSRRGREPSWPKQLPVLTEEQERIREDFYQLWLKTLPAKYKMLERFDHRYPARRHRSGERTLDIGAGIGEQLAYEDLDDQEYYALDLRQDMLDRLSERFPEAKTVLADPQKEIPFEDGYFRRVNAVHVLEHMPNLPAALREIHRVLEPGGELIVMIPCEQGLMHRFARQISARPLFEKTYGQSYDWFVATEHCNLPWEILFELKKLFSVSQRRYFPFLAPSVNLNLAIGLTCTPLVTGNGTS
jgi:SAM-dependent methyltransferase